MRVVSLCLGCIHTVRRRMYYVVSVRCYCTFFFASMILCSGVFASSYFPIRQRSDGARVIPSRRYCNCINNSGFIIARLCRHCCKPQHSNLLTVAPAKSTTTVTTMGRSQVLFNRTKARLRTGRGGGRGSPTGKRANSATNEATNDAARTGTETSWRPAKQEEDDYDDDDADNIPLRQTGESLNDGQRMSAQEAAQEAEVDLLLNLQASQAYAYPTNATIQKDPTQSGLNGLSSNEEQPYGGLNLSAMAASLSQLSLSQRLMLPRHLAATLIVSEVEQEDETVRGKCKSTASPIRNENLVPSGSTSIDSTRSSSPTASGQAGLPASFSNSSETISLLTEADVQSLAPPSQLVSENSATTTTTRHNPKTTAGAVTGAASAPDRRRHQILQRTPTSLQTQTSMLPEDEDEGDSIPWSHRHDPEELRSAASRVLMEGTPSSAASPSDTARATAYANADHYFSINADTAATQRTTADSSDYYTSVAAFGDPDEDMDQWLESALETTTFDGEEEEPLDEWLDSVIE